MLLRLHLEVFYSLYFFPAGWVVQLSVWPMSYTPTWFFQGMGWDVLNKNSYPYLHCYIYPESSSKLVSSPVVDDSMSLMV